MVIETARMRLEPYTAQQLAISRYNPERAAGLIGATIRRPGLMEMVKRAHICTIKLSLMREYPDAWLLCTYWQMVHKQSRQILGELGFKGPPIKREIELGYGTRAPFRNMGYMSEAVDALCRYASARAETGIVRILAATERDNLASQRVLQKTGFEITGRKGKLILWRRDA